MSKELLWDLDGLSECSTNFLEYNKEKQKILLLFSKWQKIFDILNKLSISNERWLLLLEDDDFVSVLILSPRVKLESTIRGKNAKTIEYIKRQIRKVVNSWDNFWKDHKDLRNELWIPSDEYRFLLDEILKEEPLNDDDFEDKKPLSLKAKRGRPSGSKGTKKYLKVSKISEYNIQKMNSNIFFEMLSNGTPIQTICNELWIVFTDYQSYYSVDSKFRQKVSDIIRLRWKKWNINVSAITTESNNRVNLDSTARYISKLNSNTFFEMLSNDIHIQTICMKLWISYGFYIRYYNDNDEFRQKVDQILEELKESNEDLDFDNSPEKPTSKDDKKIDLFLPAISQQISLKRLKNGLSFDLNKVLKLYFQFVWRELKLLFELPKQLTCSNVDQNFEEKIVLSQIETISIDELILFEKYILNLNSSRFFELLSNGNDVKLVCKIFSVDYEFYELYYQNNNEFRKKINTLQKIETKITDEFQNDFYEIKNKELELDPNDKEFHLKYFILLLVSKWLTLNKIPKIIKDPKILNYIQQNQDILKNIELILFQKVNLKLYWDISQDDKKFNLKMIIIYWFVRWLSVKKISDKLWKDNSTIIYNLIKSDSNFKNITDIVRWMK